MCNTQPYASMAMAGTRLQARRPATTETNAKAPQTNASTASETEIRCAASAPRVLKSPLSIRSKRTLVVWGTMTSPGARPLSINCASHAL